MGSAGRGADVRHLVAQLLPAQWKLRRLPLLVARLVLAVGADPVLAVVVAAGLALFFFVVVLLRGRLVDQEALEAVVERDEAVLFLVGGADVELHDACRIVRRLLDFYLMSCVLVQRARQGCKQRL